MLMSLQQMFRNFVQLSSSAPVSEAFCFLSQQSFGRYNVCVVSLGVGVLELGGIAFTCLPG